MTDIEREALCARIDELCAEVEQLHAEQAHWELGNCPGCPNVADLQEALEQNAKLLRLLRALALCADDNADCDKCVMNGAAYSSARQTFCDGMADELRAMGIEVD